MHCSLWDDVLWDKRQMRLLCHCVYGVEIGSGHRGKQETLQMRLRAIVVCTVWRRE